MTPRGQGAVSASRFVLTGALTCRTLAAQPFAAHAAERRAGVALQGDLTDEATGLKVRWSAVLRDGTSYVREELTFLSAADPDLSSVSLIALERPGGWVAGTVPGSPLVAGNEFFGFDNPMAEATVVKGHATMRLRRVLPMHAGVAVSYSAVLGVLPAGHTDAIGLEIDANDDRHAELGGKQRWIRRLVRLTTLRVVAAAPPRPRMRVG